MFSYQDRLKAADPDLWAIIQQEHQRQEQHIELIASENYTTPAVMAAQGSQLTNKYAEGYPASATTVAASTWTWPSNSRSTASRPCSAPTSMAGAANVQPHSGAQANEAVFMAFLKPGDTFMGMNLAEGGHLTHGMALNMSGKWFNVVPLRPQRPGGDRLRRDGAQGARVQAKIIIAGASAYALRIDFERFAKVAKDVGALLMVDMAHYAGLIAAGVYPNQIPHADIVTSTTHKSLRGRAAASS